MIHQIHCKGPLSGSNSEDFPINFSREEAAYKKEEERLVQNHLGKLALVYKDEVAGVFSTADEAIVEEFKRFGNVPFMVREIRLPNEQDEWISVTEFIDIHPNNYN